MAINRTDLENKLKYYKEGHGVYRLLDSDLYEECGGTTRYSIELYDELVKIFGRDYFTEMYFEDNAGILELVLVAYTGDSYVFTGLTGGYGGEGPRGSVKVLKDCGFNPNDVEYVLYEDAENLRLRK